MRKWLAFIGTELHKGLFTPQFDPGASVEVKAWAKAKGPLRLKVLEDHLATRDYLAGAFRSADTYLAAVLNWTQVTSIDLAPYPVLRSYHQRVLKRSPAARAMAEELALYRHEQAAAATAA